MPKFTVIVTRDTTESCHLDIEAPTSDLAKEQAHLAVSTDPASFRWEGDDTPNASRNVYVTNCEIAGLDECTTCTLKFPLEELDTAGDCKTCSAYDDQGNLRPGDD